MPRHRALPAGRLGILGSIGLFLDGPYGETFRRCHGMPSSHVRVMEAIERCRTPALGGHMDECDVCGERYLVWNSCNDPHCPTCGAMKRAQWLEDRRAELLPVPYFHVVFTLDHAINLLAGWNQKHVYDLLFAAATETLQQFAHRMGGILGITAMLHTWDQQLNRHLHVHCLVPAGMLSLDHTRWISCGDRFLFPVKAMSRVFRGKFVDALRSAHARGHLALPPSLAEAPPGNDFPALLRRLHRHDWVVYSEPPMGGPELVMTALRFVPHFRPALPTVSLPIRTALLISSPAQPNGLSGRPTDDAKAQNFTCAPTIARKAERPPERSQRPCRHSSRLTL